MKISPRRAPFAAWLLSLKTNNVATRLVFWKRRPKSSRRRNSNRRGNKNTRVEPNKPVGATEFSVNVSKIRVDRSRRPSWIDLITACFRTRVLIETFFADNLSRRFTRYWQITARNIPCHVRRRLVPVQRNRTYANGGNRARTERRVYSARSAGRVILAGRVQIFPKRDPTRLFRVTLTSPPSPRAVFRSTRISHNRYRLVIVPDKRKFGLVVIRAGPISNDE